MIGDKQHRQKAILELVRSRPIHTQDELVEALRELDHSVTQATVSRDIRELGLSREPSPSGSRYAIRSGLNVRLPQVLRDFVSAVDGVQFMAVVHTPPGTANLVAFAIDQSGWPEVLGTVAGDDTVLVVTTGEAERQLVEDRLLERGAEAAVLAEPEAS
ncbi:MAG TPA: arginine repressor [Candidatus Dormibacteraeota bacterium]|nr:arginine repressor [Candidatus Dormibacteraeota bacterium]